MGKNGRQRIPSYLKEDFPNPELLPCKELIASMPSHVDRPPAEKFDSIISNLYKTMSKYRAKPRAPKNLNRTLVPKEREGERLGGESTQDRRNSTVEQGATQDLN